MSDKLSEEDFNWIREFYNEDTKYYFPNRLIAEIDRLSAENKALREIVGECREAVETANEIEPLEPDGEDFPFSPRPYDSLLTRINTTTKKK